MHRKIFFRVIVLSAKRTAVSSLVVDRKWNDSRDYLSLKRHSSKKELFDKISLPEIATKQLNVILLHFVYYFPKGPAIQGAQS
jgi:hypothetical protein